LNTETQTPASAPTSAEPKDLVALVEGRLAAADAASAQADDPAVEAGAGTAAKPDSRPAEAPAKPAVDPEREKAASAYARALEADKKAQEASRKVKADREAFESERKAHATKLAEAERVLRLLQDDPRELLRMTKESPEQFVKRLATGDRTDPRIRELQERLDRDAKAREDERAQAQAEAQKREEETRKQAEDQAVAEFHGVVQARPEWGAAAWLVESDPDTARGILQNAVQEHHAATGKIPSFEEAAQRVNETLVADFEKMLSVPAFRARAEAILGPPARRGGKEAGNGSAGAHAGTPTGSSGGPTTLTNSHASSAGSAPQKLDMSDAAREARMLAKFEAALRPKA
jgi:hypothetical protein